MDFPSKENTGRIQKILREFGTLFVVRCPLLFVRWSLFAVVCYVFFVLRVLVLCSVSVVRCSLSLFFARGPLICDIWSLFVVARCLLFVVCCLLIVVC